MAWQPKSATGVAKFAFEADGKYQISLGSGDNVEILKESADWFKGINSSSGQQGIFPRNYIELSLSEASPADKSKSFKGRKKSLAGLGRPLRSASIEDAKAAATKRKNTNIRSSSKLSAAKPNTDFALLYKEIGAILKEWTALLQTHLMTQNYAEYYHVQNQISTIIEWKRMLQNPATREKAQAYFKNSVLKLIEASRKLEAGYIVPRNDAGELVSTETTSITDIHILHKKMQMRMQEGTQLPNGAMEQYEMELAKVITSQETRKWDSHETYYSSPI